VNDVEHVSKDTPLDHAYLWHCTHINGRRLRDSLKKEKGINQERGRQKNHATIYTPPGYSAHLVGSLCIAGISQSMIFWLFCNGQNSSDLSVPLRQEANHASKTQENV
jgi:hypothetical protein